MKRFSTLLLLIAFAMISAHSIPASAEKENRKIGENQIESKRAAKQQQKMLKKNAKRQRKAAKKSQKAQRRTAKNTRYHTK